MRIILLFLLTSLCFSCNPEPIKPNFLIGKWKRINEDSTKTTYEFWKPNFNGIGFTLQQQDTIFKENLRIVTKNGTSYFQVTGVNQQPTLFEIKDATENSITCVNNNNEFPKEITYWMEEGYLKAKVANEEFAIDFVFQKMK